MPLENVTLGSGCGESGWSNGAIVQRKAFTFALLLDLVGLLAEWAAESDFIFKG